MFQSNGLTRASRKFQVFLHLLVIMCAARHSLRAYQRHNSLQRSIAFLVSPLIRPITASDPVRSAFTPRTCTSSTKHAKAPICTMTLTSTEKSAAEPITGPAWELDYTSLSTPELLADIAAGTAAIEKMEQISGPVQDAVPNAASLTPETAAPVLAVARDMFDQYWTARTLIGNVYVQVYCTSSVHGSDPVAKKMQGQLSELYARMSAAYEPASLFLVLCQDEVAEAFIESNDNTRAAAFPVRHARKMKDHKLSLAEENMATRLSVTGHSAWGSLYSDLSSVISANVKQPDGSTKKMGVASASALLDSPDETVRRAAWEAIRDAWRPHDETCAAILNAITGWRQSMNEKRGYPSFLTSALHQNRMSNESLTAMFDAIDANSDVGRRALGVMAKALGKPAVDLWDFFAPAPAALAVDGEGEGSMYTFEEGVELIANAVGEVDEEAGAFVRMMMENKWIEASRGDEKRPGAYCIQFYKSRTPRVYLSDYNGRSKMLVTLAHELGHAFHAHVLKDLALPEIDYPMNLAETASIFFETVVGAALLKKASSPKEKFAMLWGDAESAASFILNIPARFEFEKQLNIRRKEGKLSAKEINDMMVQSWRRYYGDSVNDLDNVGVFSQSKLHFYMTWTSFYNFPYSFGYLFALGVYSSYENGTDKSKFSTMYRNLLKDTGRMEAEKVVEKHLGGKIYDVEYWNSAIDIVRKKVDEFEAVYKQIAYVLSPQK